MSDNEKPSRDNCYICGEPRDAHQWVAGHRRCPKALAPPPVQGEKSPISEDTVRKLVEALKFALEIIEDQAERFHKECRCQLCESAPQMIHKVLSTPELAPYREE